MDYRGKLIAYGRKSITKDALARLFGVPDDRALHEVVRGLGGLLSPVKASMTNGNLRYPLYLKYRVHAPGEDFGLELGEIAALHPLLQARGVLRQRPERYRLHREDLRRLDSFLFSFPADAVPVSRKERSFEIFSDEKRLEDRSLCRLLGALGLGGEALRYYDTPERCFNDYIPALKPRMTLLVCENKDIWFNIRRRMFEDGASVLFGAALDGVVYGCGNRVAEAGALTSYTGFLGAGGASYLYWGDVDRAGLGIFLNLRRKNPGLRIALFAAAYERMVELAEGRELPESGDGRAVTEDYGPVYRAVSERARERMAGVIGANLRIPQEIVTYRHLREEMR